MALITKVPGLIVDETSSFTFANANVTGNLTSGNASLGNIATANYFTGVLTTNAQPNITTVGTLSSLTITANVSTGGIKTDNIYYANGSPYVFAAAPAGSTTQIQFNNGGFTSASANLTFNVDTKTLAVDNISANGFGLSSLQAANISGAVANATYSVSAGTAGSADSVAGGNVSGQVSNAAVAGTVYTNAQPNITSVGNLSSLTVDNSTYGNVVITQFGSIYATAVGSNPYSIMQVVSNDGTTGMGIRAYAGQNGQIYSNTGITFTTGATVRDKDYPTGGTARATFDSTGLSVTGNITAGNANLGNAATANYFIGNGSLLTGLTSSYADSNVAAYLPTYTGNISANIANITTLNVTGTSNLGSVANVKIAGGSNGYVLQTDGSGNLSWSTGAVTTAGDAYFDSFVANGSQTVFTLAVTPTAKKYISVYIDSTYQPDDAYTLTTNNVTFVEAPVTGSVIEIRTLMPGLITTVNTTTVDTITTAAQPNITSVGTLTNLVMAGNITPATTNTYSIGNTTHRFKDLFLEGNTIYLGNATFSASDVLPFNLTIAPEILAINVDGLGPGDDIMWVWTWEQSSLPYARSTITNQAQTQVPLYKQGTYQLNNFANEIHGNLTQPHGLHLKWVDGAGFDNLVSWAVNAGNVTFSHPDINGGANTTVQRLNITVPSTVTIPTLNLPSNVYYNVAANGSGAYSITGSGVGENRNIGPLYRGATYTFNLDSTLANHPFYITTDNGTGFVSGQYVGEYTTGITGSRGNGQAGYNTLTWTVANNAPDTLYYQCRNHSPMRGAITIKDLAVETNINGNPVLYFQHAKEGHKTPVEIRPIPALVNQMCLVYDANTGQFVPQDLATYVENTPSFKNKIQEVAGTATLVAADGVIVVPTVLVVEDVSYLPLIGNKEGDIAFDAYTDTIYAWHNNAWRNTKSNLAAYAGPVSFTGANVSLGNVANLKIYGGSANQVLKTDGTGNLSWIQPSAGGGSTGITIGKQTGNALTLSLSVGNVPILTRASGSLSIPVNS